MNTIHNPWPYSKILYSAIKTSAYNVNGMIPDRRFMICTPVHYILMISLSRKILHQNLEIRMLWYEHAYDIVSFFYKLSSKLILQWRVPEEYQLKDEMMSY